MKCTDCKFCYEKDYGYSNYTVEGTTVWCLRNANPNFPKDRWYGEEPELEFANQCPLFIEGNSTLFKRMWKTATRIFLKNSIKKEKS